jgi:alpha-N-arabinofuranosidase
MKTRLPHFSHLNLPEIFFATCTLLPGLSSAMAPEETASITVQADQAGLPVAPTLHGLFFEDINYAADGGLYAELVQNRSFEHREATYAWTQIARGDAQGKIMVATDAPLNANNPQFLRLEVGQAGAGGVGAVNSGFDGITLRKDEVYRFSIYARRHAGENAALQVQLEDAGGHVLAAGHIADVGTEWKKYEFTLKSTGTEPNARLVMLDTTTGAIDVDMVSLFP